MTVRDIVKMGVPQLIAGAKRVVDLQEPSLPQLIQDLQDTQRYFSGAGLAAPQIGVNLRVIVFGFELCSRYPEREPIEETVLINPEYQPVSQEQSLDWEGCLSVPGLRGVVSRYLQIVYSGVDLIGNRIERTVEGFHARVVQHEIDHLDGILFVQRLHDPRWFGFEDVLDLDQINLN